MAGKGKYEDRILITDNNVMIRNEILEQMPQFSLNRNKIVCKQNNSLILRDCTIDEKGHKVIKFSDRKSVVVHIRYKIPKGHYKYEINKYGEIIINLEDCAQ